jgi:membrane associated rhomboid family serine protease
VIPISDDNPVRTTPGVTILVIALCVLVYVWELSLGADRGAAMVVLGFIPAAFFGHAATMPGFVPVSPTLTIFTSMFIHGGLLHVGGNMLYLWIFGNNVEDQLGHVRYLIFYLVCGVAAALTMAFVDPSSQLPMIGASGAISGVLASYVLFFPRAKVTVIVPLGIIFYPFAIGATWVVGLWFGMQLLSAALADPGQPGTAWWAHVGGFACGLLLTPILKPRDARMFGEVHRGPWG